MDVVLRALRTMWPVGLGLIPLGLAFGVLMTHSGFAWWWTPIFSLVIYAGSMEYLAIGMVTAGIGPVTSAITGMMINFRHIFYGITFPRHLVPGRFAQAYVTYALTDEVYATVSTARVREGREIFWIAMLCQSMWVIPGIIGALGGQAIPSHLEGFEFALVALFIVLAIEAYKASPALQLVFIALACALIGALVLPQHFLVVALTAYFLILLLRWKAMS